MFMCLTYTGDLLADAFISLYSKMVNLIYRQICRGRMRKCLPENPRQSFEHPDVGPQASLSNLDSIAFSRANRKKLAMFPSLQHWLFWRFTLPWVHYSLLNGRIGLFLMALTFVLSPSPPLASEIWCREKEQ